MSGPSITNPASATPQWQAVAPASSIISGAQATTASAVALPSYALTSQVTLKAPKANAASVEIGVAGLTTGTGFVLDPGDQITLHITNLNLLEMIGANTTDHLTWIGY